jgi:hypothetical protein
LAPTLVEKAVDHYRNVQLVFCYDKVSPEPFAPDERPEFSYRILTVELLARYFADEPWHVRSFSTQMKRGCVGALVTCAGEWASFVWLKPPGRKAPVGLPPNAARGRYWLYHSFTKEKFRGQGLYKRNMGFLMNEVIRREERPLIYGMVRADNLAPRSALLWLGFKPCGVMTVYSIWIPKLVRYSFYGDWRQKMAHEAVIPPQ